jgi:hypothetical protein
MPDKEQDKLTLHTPGSSTSLANRIKIGGSKLHQRVAAAAPLDVAKQAALSVPLQVPNAKNPYDASLEMPNRIGMMLDGSFSMCSAEGDGKSKINHLKEACLDFIRSCDFSTTSIAIETFPTSGVEDDDEGAWAPQNNDPLAHLLPPGQSPQRSRKSARRGLCNIEAFLQADIDALQACGGTPMAGAMQRSLTTNSLTRGILVSDGEADSAQRAIDIAKQWKEAEIAIDCVHIGRSSSGEALLKEIAELTGGLYIKFDNVSNFSKHFKYLAPAFRAMLTSGSAGMLGAKEVK